ncbi:hypothetical protein F5148DRAFT_980567, partial [Russula earlei]
APRSSSRGRGRVGARFSIASVSSSILDAVRTVSGASAERRPQRGLEGRGDDYSHVPPSHFGLLSETGGLDSNEQVSEGTGNGWQEFKKGTYTFPISFAIPSHVPPSVRCENGSVTWRLKANVHRPGAFTPKLSASREVILVASPSEDSREDNGLANIERAWEDQLQYALSVSGRVFPIGGTVPMTLNLLPMAKVKVFRILVQLEEQVEYLYSFSPNARRKDAERRFKLLSLESGDEDTPLLPLSGTSLADSPLRAILKADDSSSELIANLMGPGPWTFPMALTVPSAEGVLHFSNKNNRAPIEISHTLKVVVRVQRGDDKEIDPQTGRRKFFDITMRVPVHILSSLSNDQHTALPRYSECPYAPSSAAAPPYSSTESRRRASHPPNAALLHSQAATGVDTPFASPHERTLNEVDALYHRNVIFEQLITGQQREDGVVPPAYYPAS